MGLQMKTLGEMKSHWLAPPKEDDDHHPHTDLIAPQLLVKHQDQLDSNVFESRFIAANPDDPLPGGSGSPNDWL